MKNNITKQELMNEAYKGLKLYNGILIGSLVCMVVGLGGAAVATVKARIDYRKQNDNNDSEDDDE